MLTKTQVQELVQQANATSGEDTAAVTGLIGAVNSIAEYALRAPKRRKIFLVTVITSDEDGSRQRVTYGVAARSERRAVEMVEQAIAGEYELKDVSERENPWVVSTGAEG